MQLLENENQNLRNINENLKDESKRQLSIIEFLAGSKTIDTPRQTSTSKAQNQI